MKFDRKRFFTAYRQVFPGPISQKQVDGLEILLSGMEKAWGDPRWIAYALATVKHETANTFQPIYEKGAKSYFNQYDIAHNPKKAKALGNTQVGDGYKFRGRGYVQLTGRKNYTRYSIADNPDAALDPKVAVHILIDGMEKGVFTGKKLGDYIQVGSVADYKNARRVINGTDKAALIAGYAEKFETILKLSAALPQTPTNSLTDESVKQIDSATPPPIQVEAEIKQPEASGIVVQEGPKPYNDVGLKDTLKNDAKAVVPANFGLQTVSEYVQQTAGWPEWVVALATKAALILLIASVVWVLYRIVSYVLHNFRENEKQKLMAMINTDATRKDIEIK